MAGEIPRTHADWKALGWHEETIKGTAYDAGAYDAIPGRLIRFDPNVNDPREVTFSTGPRPTNAHRTLRDPTFELVYIMSKDFQAARALSSVIGWSGGDIDTATGLLRLRGTTSAPAASELDSWTIWGEERIQNLAQGNTTYPWVLTLCVCQTLTVTFKRNGEIQVEVRGWNAETSHTAPGASAALPSADDSTLPWDWRSDQASAITYTVGGSANTHIRMEEWTIEISNEDMDRTRNNARIADNIFAGGQHLRGHMRFWEIDDELKKMMESDPNAAGGKMTMEIILSKTSTYMKATLTDLIPKTGPNTSKMPGGGSKFIEFDYEVLGDTSFAFDFVS